MKRYKCYYLDFLVTKTKEKKGRSRSRWMDNVKLDLKNMGIKGGGKDLWIEENGLCLEGNQRQT